MFTKKDYESDQEVRWCPGCGDYAVLASVQKVLVDLQKKPENQVFISGIGCSSRFPYYINAYGFHTIHGRAPTFATGLKLMRPELDVWVITGDGDGLSIGANHLIHMMRRNINVTILLFNNRIYGLTKGQISPTSGLNKITKTTPLGSIDEPLDPIAIALAAGCSFVARGIDIDTKGLQTILKRAAQHEGTSFVEIYQNCNVFNDGAFDHFAEKSVRDEKTIWLDIDEPLLFGNNHSLGIQLGDKGLIVVKVTKQNQAHILRYNQEIGLIMSMLQPQNDLPLPIGIFREIIRPTYDKLSDEKSVGTQPIAKDKLQVFLERGDVWEV